jgi:hypothetical protein
MLTESNADSMTAQKMLSQIFGSCWITNRLERMDAQLTFHWSEADRWEEVRSAWAKPLLTHGPVVPCPASSPSSPQALALARTVMILRPNLEQFSMGFDCHTNTWSCQNSLGPARWQMEYPAVPAAQSSEDKASPANEKQVRTLSMPMNGATLDVIAYNGHRDSACCLGTRKEEDAIVRELAWKIRAETDEMPCDF